MTNPTTEKPASLLDPAARAVQAAERVVKRRPVLERCVERLKENRQQAVARLVPNWTDEELATLLPIAERHKRRELSYYKACVEGRKVLPGRSWQAIRKKLKNFTAHGSFKP